jgi:hypothetical protein
MSTRCVAIYFDGNLGKTGIHLDAMMECTATGPHQPVAVLLLCFLESARISFRPIGRLSKTLAGHGKYLQ